MRENQTQTPPNGHRTGTESPDSTPEWEYHIQLADGTPISATDRGYRTGEYGVTLKRRDGSYDFYPWLYIRCISKRRKT